MMTQLSLGRLTAAALLAGFLILRGVFVPSHSQSTNLNGERRSEQTTATKPIERIEVGQRVLGEELYQQSRMPEPNWAQWLLLEAVLEDPTHSDRSSKGLKIQLLRPEAWVREQIRLVSTRTMIDFSASPKLAELQGSVVPLRGIYLDLLEELVQLEDQGQVLERIELDLDLPEMGAVGLARITAIANCPIIEPGPGNVVTATFAHPATVAVFDVAFGNHDSPGSVDTVGVTSNHPFWSVDRNRFVPVAEMTIGERLRTYQGTTSQLLHKIARSGQHQVYNLEVYNQHVYYVGDSNVLVHNSCVRDDWENEPRDRPTYSARESRELGLNPVPTRGALVSGRPLSTQEDHHIASPYKRQLREIFRSVGLNIRTHKPNLLPLSFHTGPHLPKYHEFVRRVLLRAIGGSDGPDAVLAINGALSKLGRFLEKHPAIPNFFRL